MIGWLNPVALAGLVLLGVPVILHLLRRQTASRVPFPSLRFVPRSRAAAVRLSRLSDWPLLIVRLGVVVAAVVAAAEPVIVTPERLAYWNSRVVRGIVTDGSAEAAAMADREAGAAWRAFRIETGDPAAGIARAAARLSDEPPARREIVVIGPLRLGALDEGALTDAPVGIRFVPIGDTTTETRFTGLHLFTDTATGLVQEVRADIRRSQVALAPRPSEQAGLRILARPEDADRVAEMARVVARLGAPAPAGAEPVVLRLRGATLPRPPEALDQRWMAATVVRLLHDEELARAARQYEGGAALDEDVGIVVARTSGGSAVVTAARLGTELLVNVAAGADEYLAVATLRAILEARRGPVAWPGQEPARIPEAQLAAWSREAPPLPADVWRRAEASDARWPWAAALALLGVESWLRRRSRPHVRREESHVRAA